MQSNNPQQVGEILSTSTEQITERKKECPICKKQLTGMNAIDFAKFFNRSIQDGMEALSTKNPDEIVWEDCYECKRRKEENRWKEDRLKRLRESFGLYSGKDKRGLYYSVNNPYSNNQIELFRRFKENPLSSWYIYGDYGTYKTSAMYSMLYYLVENNIIDTYNVFSNDELTEAIARHKRGEQQGTFYSSHILSLPISRGYVLCLDDIDKFKWSETAQQGMQSIFDVIHRLGNNYQFIITANMPLNMFAEFVGGRFGKSVFRRMKEKANIFELKKQQYN